MATSPGSRSRRTHLEKRFSRYDRVSIVILVMMIATIAWGVYASLVRDAAPVVLLPAAAAATFALTTARE